MPSLRVRKDNGRLYVDFRHGGRRRRELLPYLDIPGERRKAENFVAHLTAALADGTFRDADYFPDSRAAHRTGDGCDATCCPRLRDFQSAWVAEMTPQWSTSHLRTVQGIVRKHLLPRFGDRWINRITRADVLSFRAELAKCPGRRGALTASRINKVMCILREIVREAAARYDFPQPFREIRPLRMIRRDIHPFSLDEVHALIEGIDPHFRRYLATRFFTAMRSGEINALRWINVDRAAGLIKVRETLVAGGLEEGAKTERSERDIPMLPVVREAIDAQWESRDPACPYVFPSRRGFPIDAKNFNNRVWLPLLDRLGLERRRPYQTRHTAATLMLAAGENPEWVAHVLGHSNLQLLFRVYARYVPNLTRRDGSAIADLVARKWGATDATSGRTTPTDGAHIPPSVTLHMEDEYRSTD